jgi:hypothetical protein
MFLTFPGHAYAHPRALCADAYSEHISRSAGDCQCALFTEAHNGHTPHNNGSGNAFALSEPLLCGVFTRGNMGNILVSRPAFYPLPSAADSNWSISPVSPLRIAV